MTETRVTAVLTPGMRAYAPLDRMEILRRVVSAFDGDPRSGAFDYDGERIVWKLDRPTENAAPRLLVIMLGHEADQASDAWISDDA